MHDMFDFIMVTELILIKLVIIGAVVYVVGPIIWGE